MATLEQLATGANDAIFRALHRRHLVYNTSWEDPRIDRELLRIDSASRVVVITSGGCNTLDYLLDDPAEVHAVDVNPAQNALLQLKLALIERGDFDDLYQMFGVGTHRSCRGLLDSLSPKLSEFAFRFWKAKSDYFVPGGVRSSFYYRGTAGAAAWLFRNLLLEAKKNLRHLVLALFEAQSLEEQRLLFEGIEPRLWDRVTSWMIECRPVLALFGLPQTQIELIARSYHDGMVGYVRDKLRHVLTNLLTRDNYFWRVYLYGSYQSSCCPAYLEPANFSTLRARAERVRTHDTTIARFLSGTTGEFTHFALLDHQDWLAHKAPEALNEEWQHILARSRRGTRILMRSAGPTLDFLPERARRALRFFPRWTERLHRLDRVGTYGSTHLAEVA